MITVFFNGKNQKDHLFVQASQIFRIAAHPLHPHANAEKRWLTSVSKLQPNFAYISHVSAAIANVNSVYTSNI